MPRVLTIAPSAPFLPTLARALLDGAVIPGFVPAKDALGPSLALARATIFLPTRRAGRAFAEALLQAAGGRGLLLPKIVPLGDVDEDALAFSEDAPLLAPPRAISPVARRIVLSALVAHWRDALAKSAGQAAVAAGPASTVALADELARLFDQMTSARLPLSRLEGLVPQEHDPYFELSLDFLRIARKAFDAHLAEAGLAEPVARRDALVAAEAERLTRLGAEAGPVIAAGSTGSLRATARLLSAIARLPQGAVVLPGLDLHLEDDAFARLTDAADPAPDHPQFGLASLLPALGISRAGVGQIGTPLAPARDLMVSEAMRQGATTDRWADLPERVGAPLMDAAMARVSVIQAADPREEALTLALLLRDALTRPDEQAALITQDRDLARRVVCELEQFAIAIDDSAGEPLAETGPGRLARLLADVAAQACAPVQLFALLTHPRATFGLEDQDRAQAVAALELVALRGPRPNGGTKGLKDALDAFDPDGLREADPRRRVDAPRLAAARDLVDRLDGALAPLLGFTGRGAVPLTGLVAAHIHAMEAAMGPLLPDADDPAMAALASAMAEIEAGAGNGPALTLPAYAETVAALFADAMVRPKAEKNPRVRILGPLEARLMAFDRVILAGLVEGVWPPQTRTDPWLSRPMRAELGLDLPERRIGLSAHDFAQAFGGGEVILTFPEKVEGTKTVPSRFLQRLMTVAGPERWSAAKARGEAFRRAAAHLDDAPAEPRPGRPSPAPPLALRPLRLSVTQVETLLRDPYSIYARHVLGLQPLDPLDAAPGALERGNAMHAALGAFALAFPEGLPNDPHAELLRFGREAFRPLEAFPAEHAAWWARYVRVAAFMAGFERERRAGLAHVAAEVGGGLPIGLGERTFTLTARADRIEVGADGRLAILDYKTGTAPSTRQGRAFSPQLPLEAAMAARGAFRDVPANTVTDFAYVELKGGAAGGAFKPAVLKDRTATEMGEEALARLTELLLAFEDERQGYPSLLAPQWRGRFGPYDHLARVREWALSGEEEA